MFFFLGLFIIAIGFAFSYEAKLGVSPWDVLHIGLYQVSSIAIGYWVIGIGVMLVGVTFFLNRSLIGWGTIGNMFFVGFFMNLVLKWELVPPVNHLWLRILYMILGIIISGIGTGLYLAPRFGAGPRDGLTLELAKRFSFSVRKMRTIMEVTVVIIGWLLGGPLFVGTVLFSLSIGPCFQFFLHIFEGFLTTLSKKIDTRIHNKIETKYKT